MPHPRPSTATAVPLPRMLAAHHLRRLLPPLPAKASGRIGAGEGAGAGAATTPPPPAKRLVGRGERLNAELEGVGAGRVGTEAAVFVCRSSLCVAMRLPHAHLLFFRLASRVQRSGSHFHNENNSQFHTCTVLFCGYLLTMTLTSGRQWLPMPRPPSKVRVTAAIRMQLPGSA